MTSFAELKSSRKSSLEALISETNKINSPGGDRQGADDNLWKPDVDKAGNGYAVIRFLPAPEGEDLPWVRMFNHGFQGPGGWYIENSLTTINKKDPVSEHNSMLWNSGIESNKDLVRKQKRRLNYYSNIYIVKDPTRPENEGKVFLFKFGKKIFDKCNEAMNPQFEDEKPVNPFDFWEGANFKLKIRQVEGYRNYDKSEFDTSSTLLDNDEELEKVWKSQHSLSELVAPEQFKSYEELKTKLNRVLGLDGTVQSGTTAEDVEPTPIRSAPEPNLASDDDSDMSFFEKLANDNA